MRFSIRQLLIVTTFVSVIASFWGAQRTRYVLIATKNIEIGELLSPNNLVRERHPVGQFPKDAPSRFEDVAGFCDSQYHWRGEPLLAGKIMSTELVDRGCFWPHDPVCQLRVVEFCHQDPESIAPEDRVDVYSGDKVIAAEATVFVVKMSWMKSEGVDVALIPQLFGVTASLLGEAKGMAFLSKMFLQSKSAVKRPHDETQIIRLIRSPTTDSSPLRDSSSGHSQLRDSC